MDQQSIRKRRTMFRLEEVPFVLKNSAVGLRICDASNTPLKGSQSTTPLFFVFYFLHTGDCEENHSYYIQCLAVVVLARQHILPDIKKKFAEGEAFGILRTTPTRSTSNKNAEFQNTLKEGNIRYPTKFLRKMCLEVSPSAGKGN